jgi:hypothetical protein
MIKVLTDDEKRICLRIAKIKVPDLVRRRILDTIDAGEVEVKDDVLEFLSRENISLFELLDTLHQALFWSSRSVDKWGVDDESLENEEFPKPILLGNMLMSELIEMAQICYGDFLECQ